METTLETLRAAADPSRLRLLCLLESGELTVSELVTITGQSQPRISRHLKILVDANLLVRIREGSWVFHRLNNTQLARKIVDLVPKGDPLRQEDSARLQKVQAVRAEIADTYFAKYAPEWDRLRQLDVDEDAVADAVKSMLPLEPTPRLLDLGTGTGRMLEILAHRAIEAIGIDSSHEMLAVARANIARKNLDNCQLRQADILSLPLSLGQFDTIVMHQVLHFLDRPWLALGEAARLLTPGGKLLVIDLAPHHMEDLREQHAHRRLGFSDVEVREWLADQGLTCETIRHLNSGGPLNVTLWLATRQHLTGL